MRLINASISHLGISMRSLFAKSIYVAGQIVKSVLLAFVIFGALSILGIFEVRSAY